MTNAGTSALYWKRDFSGLSDDIPGLVGAGRRSRTPLIFGGPRPQVAPLCPPESQTIDRQPPVFVNSTDSFNSWLNKHVHEEEYRSVKKFRDARSGVWKFRFHSKVTFPEDFRVLEIKATAVKDSYKLAKEHVYNQLLNQVSGLETKQVIVPQMAGEEPTEAPSKESVQGDASQTSLKATSTIITKDQGETSSIPDKPSETSFKLISSSEAISTFSPVTHRWMPLGKLEIAATSTYATVLATYVLPSDCYTSTASAPNLMPFEQYVYSRPDIMLRFVVNANKFHCGKILIALRFDDFQCQTQTQVINGALSRPHVFLDLTANNQATLRVPFRFHRSFMRTNATETTNVGVTSARCASVDIIVLSPLATATGQSTSVEMRTFFTFEKSEFAGLSYRYALTAQGPDVIDNVLDQIPTKGLKRILAGAESLLDRIGGHNMDKPLSFSDSVVIPRPRVNFVGGKGLSDALPMRLNPVTQTSYHDGIMVGDEAETTLDLARIWQLRSKFTWANTDAADAVLVEFTPDPFTRSYTDTYYGSLTLLEDVSSMYNFFSGTIDLRLDFISNSFHTGAIVISTEFNRYSTDTDATQSYSTYTKTFHLGEQKSVHYRIPYIYDTIWRRNTSGCYQQLLGTQENTAKIETIYMRPEINTKVKIRVLNELRPVTTVAQKIEVLMYWRAGPNYHLHSLCQSSYVFGPSIALPNIPRDYPPSSSVSTAVAETRLKSLKAAVGVEEKLIESFKALNKKKDKAEKNTIKAQMDTGEKENEDTTQVFSPGTSSTTAQSTDVQLNIKDILRTPILYLSADISARGDQNTAFYFPVRPPAFNTFAYGTFSTSGATLSKNQSYNPGLARTPHGKLLSYYRFWRGSQRFTFVFNSYTATNPIYITYIPHSGSWQNGNYNSAPAATLLSPLYGSGFRSVMVCPSINNTEVVEAPYDTENNWTLMYNDTQSTVFSYRDMGDYDCGMIAIQCKTAVSVEVFWSAGDDFEVSNFYGPVSRYSNAYIAAYSDASSTSTTATTSAEKVIKPQMADPEEDFHDADSGDSSCPVTVPSDAVPSTSEGYVHRKVRTAYNTVTSLPEVVKNAAIGTIPYVGTPIVVARTISNVEHQVEEAVKAVNDLQKPLVSTLNSVENGIAEAVQSVNKIQDQVTQANIPALSASLQKSCSTFQEVSNTLGNLMAGPVATSVEQITKLTEFINSLLDSAVSKLGCVVDLDFKQLIGEFFLDILVHLKTGDYFGMGLSFFRTLIRYLKIPVWSTIMNFGHQLGEVFRRVFSINAQSEDLELTIVPLVSVFLAFVGTIVGVTMDPKSVNWRQFTKGLVLRLTAASGIGYIAGVMRVTTNMFELCRRIMAWMTGESDPSILALQKLEGMTGELSIFVKESQLMMSEANSRMFSNAEFKLRYWVNLMQAYQIQTFLTRVPHNKVSPVLSTLCRDVIRHANDHFVDISCSPFKYEPFVLCIEGAPGVGKSHSANYIANELLKSIGVTKTMGDQVYTRMPGSKYWSGYNSQPVVVYDDWLNLNDDESITQMVSELYQLKSTSTFIPEMAHLEDKRRKANPFLVILCCNKAYPGHALRNVAFHLDAIYRRRDQVWQLTSTKSTSELTEIETMDEYGHAAMARYPNPREETDPGQPMPFATAMQEIITGFQKHHKQQQVRVKHQVERFQADVPATTQRLLNVDDPFSLYFTQCVNTELSRISEALPSEYLDAEIDRLSKALAKFREGVEIEGDIVLPGEIREQGFMEELARWIVYCPKAIFYAAKWTTGRMQAFLECLQTKSYKEVKVPCLECHEEVQPYAQCSCCEAFYCRDCFRRDTLKPSTFIHEEDVNLLFRFLCNQKPPCVSEECPGILIQVSAPMTCCGLICLSRLYSQGLLTFENLLDRVYVLLRGLYPFMVIADIRATAYMAYTSTFGLYGPSGAGMTFVLNQNNIVYPTAGVCHYQMGASECDSLDSSANLPGTSTSVDDVIPGLSDIGIGESTARRYAPETDYSYVNQYYNSCARVDQECHHPQLLELSHCVRYEDGEWLLPDGLKIKDVKCLGYCAWDEEPMGAWDFWAQHLAVFGPRYTEIIRLHGATMEKMPGLMKKVPFCALPRWVRNNNLKATLLLKEIKSLTQGSWIDYITNPTVVRALKGLAIIAAVGGTVYASIRAFSLLFPAAVATGAAIAATAQASYEGVSTHHFARTQRMKAARQNRPPVRMQVAEEEADPFISVQRKIRRNMFWISVVVGKRIVQKLGVTGFVGFKSIMPGHYYGQMKRAIEKYGKEVHFVLYQPTTQCTCEYTFDDKDFIVSELTDICVFNVPPSFPMFKDISRYFAKDKDLRSDVYGQGGLVLHPTIKEETVDVTIEGTVEGEVITGDSGQYQANGLIRYNYSKLGACGSILLKRNTQRPIYGMHIAGVGELSEGSGYSVILTQEGMADFVETTLLKEQAEPEISVDFEKAKVLFDEDNCVVEYLGVAEQTPFLPVKSKIKPSLIQSEWKGEIKTKPCFLSVRDDYPHPHSPLRLGCEKHGHLTKNFPTSTIQMAKEALWIKLYDNMKPLVADPRKLTPQQAAVGVVGVDHYEYLDLNTSAGYPWNLGARQGKSDYIEYIRNESQQPVDAVISAEVLEVMETKRQMRERGIVPVTIFCDVLKDERRKIKKVYSPGGTRVFCMSPVDYSLSLRQTFLHFTAAFVAQRWDLCHAVGIDANGVEWSELTRRLMVGATKFVSIDYSNFGPAFNACIAKAASEIMVRWVVENVGDVDEAEAMCLLAEAFQSTHLCANLVYRQMCGSPSGSPLTTVINTIVNQLYLLCAWIMLAPSHIRTNDFFEEVNLFAYGDDVVMGVSDECVSWFNAVSISELFAKYDLVISMSDKEANIVPWQSISEITFLKRAWRHHERFKSEWQGALDKTSVEECALWIWQSPNDKEATDINCMAALELAYGWGSAYFEDFRNKLNTCRKARGLSPIAVMWEELDRVFYPNYYL